MLSISFCPSHTDQSAPSGVVCFTSDLSLTDPDNRSELLFDFKWRAVEQGYLLAVPPLQIEFPDMSGPRGAGWLHSFELSFKNAFQVSHLIESS